MLIPLSLGEAAQLGPARPFTPCSVPHLNYLHLESRPMLCPLGKGRSHMKG